MTDVGAVRGLLDLWSSVSSAGQAARPLPLRPLLDTLGIGLEQAMTHLGRRRPDWDAFVAWVAATGSNDAAAIARYNAWYDGDEPPTDERTRQAEVMAALRTEGPVFSTAQIEEWDRDGVIVLPAAIAADEAAAIATHLWEWKGATPDDPDSWYGRIDNGIMVQEFQHPAMAVPRRATRIQRAFAQLYGHADLIVSTDRLSFNPPIRDGYTFPGPHLHWDTSLAPPIPFELQGILYLTDTDAAQGALRVVKGFHHRLAQGWLEALAGGDPRAVDLSAEAVPIAGKAGDLVIWRQDLPHGASANTAARPRLAQYVTMYPMHWPDTRVWL